MSTPSLDGPDRVVLLCGPAGSGKSTLARRLADDGYTVLSFDEEAWRRGHRQHPLDDGAAAEVHAFLQRRLVELVEDGARVVVDSSFWSQASRDRYRNIARRLGIEPVVYYLDTPRATMLDRVAARRGNGPHDISVSPDVALGYVDGFEIPTAAEGPLRTISA